MMNRLRPPTLVLAIFMLATILPGAAAGPLGPYDHLDCGQPDNDVAGPQKLPRGAAWESYWEECPAWMGHDTLSIGFWDFKLADPDPYDMYEIDLYAQEYFWILLHGIDCTQVDGLEISVVGPGVSEWLWVECPGGHWSDAIDFTAEEAGTYTLTVHPGITFEKGQGTRYTLSYFINDAPAADVPYREEQPTEESASTAEVGETAQWQTEISWGANVHDVTFDWGDGTQTTSASDGDESYIAAHAYAHTGSYCVRAFAHRADDPGQRGPWSECHTLVVTGEVTVDVVPISKITDIGTSETATATLTLESGTLRAQVSGAFYDQSFVFPRVNGIPAPSSLDQDAGPVSTRYTVDDPCHRVAGTCQLTLGYQAGSDFVKVGELWESLLEIRLDGETVSSLPFVEVRL